MAAQVRQVQHPAATGLILCALVLALLLPQDVASAPAAAARSGDDLTLTEVIHTTLDRLDGDDMVANVTVAQEFYTRYYASDNNSKAVDWLVATLSELGYEVRRDPFLGWGLPLENVLAIKNGTDPDASQYIVGAHLDSIVHARYLGDPHNSFEHPNTYAPGADDDGSGVAVLLAMAAALKDVQTRHTLIFAFWNAEEIGHGLGSIAYADAAAARGDPIALYLNIDNVGDNPYYLKSDVVYFAGKVGPVQELQALAQQYNPQHLLLSFEDPNDPKFWSDGENFLDAGFETFAIIESMSLIDESPYYKPRKSFHTVNDLAQWLNPTLLEMVAKTVAVFLLAKTQPVPPQLVATIETPPTAMVDEGLTVQGSVRNDGTGPATFVWELWLDDTSIGAGNGTLQPDEVLPISVVTTPMIAGDHTLRLQVTTPLLQLVSDDDVAWATLVVTTRPAVQLEVPATLPLVPLVGGVSTTLALVRNVGGSATACTLTLRVGDAGGQLLAATPGPLSLDAGGVSVVPLSFVTTVPGERPLHFALEGCTPTVDALRSNLSADRIVLVNAAPLVVVNTTTPQPLTVGSPIEFVALSADTDVLGLLWSFGDGTGALFGPERTRSHAYERPGTYTVSVIAIDTLGVSGAAATTQVQLADQPPVVAPLQMPEGLAIGAPIDIVAGATDLEDPGALTYRWSMGDGTIAEGPVVHHFYNQPRPYQITLEVTDPAGHLVVVSAQLRVYDPTPQVSLSLVGIGPPQGSGPQARALVRLHIDVTGGETAITRSVDWGDGSAPQAAADGTPTHRFVVGVRYHVVVTVSDQDGHRSAATLSVDVPSPASGDPRCGSCTGAVGPPGLLVGAGIVASLLCSGILLAAAERRVGTASTTAARAPRVLPWRAAAHHRNLEAEFFTPRREQSPQVGAAQSPDEE